MAFFQDTAGVIQHVEIKPEVFKAAHDSNLTVEQYLNRQYAADADQALGTPFQQLCASEGLAIPGKNAFGLRSATIAEILDGKGGAMAGINTRDQGTPFGTSSRTLFPPAIIAVIESELAKDRETDSAMFNQMVGQDIAVSNENFEQPVVDYATAQGPEQARAQRVAQNAEPATVLKFRTSDRIRRIPSWAIGMEFSDQALRASTLDMVALMTARYMACEMDAHVYEFLSDLFTGDNDLNVGAISAVTSSTLNGSATSGTLTDKAWLKFLYRNRKYRRITHVICDFDTYLKIQNRTGRAGLTDYDTTLARLDVQARVANPAPLNGGDVAVFLVDPASEGGPVPANTVWALDARSAITRVTNTAANYSASEQFALRRSTAMRMDWGQICYRTFGNTALKAFDVLTID